MGFQPKSVDYCHKSTPVIALFKLRSGKPYNELEIEWVLSQVGSELIHQYDQIIISANWVFSRDYLPYPLKRFFFRQFFAPFTFSTLQRRALNPGNPEIGST